MPETWASVGGVRPRAGINSALPRLTARPRGAPGSREGARGKKKKKKLGGSLGLRSRRDLAFYLLFVIIFYFFTHGEKQRRGRTREAPSPAFPRSLPAAQGRCWKPPGGRSVREGG